MRGFGVHTSMWTMSWDRAGCERAVAKAAGYGMDFLEIALLNPSAVDPAHSRQVLEAAEMRAVCSLGLPEGRWASRNPDGAAEFLCQALDVAAAIGAEALTGVVYGGIGERTGEPPTEAELDRVADPAVDDTGQRLRPDGRGDVERLAKEFRRPVGV
ncbi:MAG: hypothetical protein AAFW69_00265, partial [Pseudomonadota bacterium]